MNEKVALVLEERTDLLLTDLALDWTTGVVPARLPTRTFAVNVGHVIGQLVVSAELGVAGRAGKFFAAVAGSGHNFGHVKNSAVGLERIPARPFLVGGFLLREGPVLIGDVIRHEFDEVGVFGAVVNGQSVSGDGAEIAQLTHKKSGQP